MSVTLLGEHVLPSLVSSIVFASSGSLSVKLSFILELRLSWVRKLGRRLGISAASMSGDFMKKKTRQKKERDAVKKAQNKIDDVHA